MDWISARNAVRDKGGLPSHVLLDDLTLKTSVFNAMECGSCILWLYSLWAKEVIVHPPQHGRFEKGKDVLGTHCPYNSVSIVTDPPWVFPASCIPDEAIGMEKVALFVDPGKIEVTPKNVVILAEPKSIVVLHPFIQGVTMRESLEGKVDRTTRIPLEADPEELASLDWSQKACLEKQNSAGAGVRPILRRINRTGYGGSRWVVIPESRYANGVSYVASEEPKINTEMSPALGNKGVLVKGATLEELRELLEHATANLRELEETVKPGKLSAMQQLIDALTLKQL